MDILKYRQLIQMKIHKRLYRFIGGVYKMMYDKGKKIIEQTNWLNLAKECLSIISSSTMKDKEITMLLESAITDLERVDIDVTNNIEDNLIKNTVMIYVKAHFGDTDINKKNEYLKRYKMNLRELQNTEKYQKKEVDGNA